MVRGIENAALVLVDVQQGLDDPSQGQRNNPEAETCMAVLLANWRERAAPIVHIRHCSTEATSLLRPELPGNAFKDAVRPEPGETIFDKSVNSAFVGTGLEHYLREQGIAQLVIAGLTTDHCVSATTRSASDLGFEVALIEDATAAFGREAYDGRYYSGDEIHRVSLVSLDGEFCRVSSTRDILQALQDAAASQSEA